MFCIDCYEKIMDLIYNMIHSTSFENRKPSSWIGRVCVCLWVSVCAYLFPNKHNLIANFKPINIFNLREVKLKSLGIGFEFDFSFLFNFSLFISQSCSLRFMFMASIQVLLLYVFTNAKVLILLDIHRLQWLNGIIRSNFLNWLCLIMQLLSSCWGWFTIAELVGRCKNRSIN